MQTYLKATVYICESQTKQHNILSVQRHSHHLPTAPSSTTVYDHSLDMDKRHYTHWNMPKYNEDWRTIQKALKSIHNFNTSYGVTFTNLCTACSSRHSLIPHTYTATYVYTYTAAHIPRQLCTYVYIHVLKVVCEGIWTYEHAHRSMGAEHLLVAWDVILGHVGGIASVSSAYICMAFHTILQL